MTKPEAGGFIVRSEDDRLAGRTVTLVAVGVVVLVWLWIGVAWLLLARGEDRARPSGVFTELALAPPPTVSGVEQTLIVERDVAGDLAAHKRAVLQSYGWIDADRGIVRIPIERAMEIVAAEGERP
jgi:hypothetical protein